MRILAIRGKNLASLAGEFEIDFVSGPLAQLRLFAITGPTGVGKSTLLDALCLALFDRTPRLDFKRGPEIGRGEEDGDWLKSYDVRSLLRRGEAEGFAQVDFVGSDERELRSTWSVGRARGRKDGKLQAQTMSLVDLATGASLGGTKTETLEAIEKKLGLKFEQFCKSVLLAQGEFAEFLKADANERSELLQKITGTEIYERISKAAFQKAREVRDLLSSKEQLLAGLVVLENVDREQLDREAKEADERVKTAVTREKLLEEAGRKAAAARASAEVAEAKAREARTAAEKSSVAEGRAKAALEAAVARERELADAKGTREARRGEIESARELDVRLDAAKATAKEATRRQEEAEGLAAQAREDLATCEAAEDAARKAREEIEARLLDHDASRPVQEKWDVWNRSLDELVRTSGELVEFEISHSRSVAAVAAAEKAVGELEARIADHATKLESVKSERKASEERLAAIPAGTHRLRQSSLSGIVEALSGLEGIRSRAGDSSAAEGEAKRKEEAARAESARAVAAEAPARKALESTEASLSEARRGLSVAEAVRDLTARRADLVDGSPCPLCGATEHPWGAGAPIDAAVQTFRDRVLELDRSAKKLNAEAEREAATAKAEGRKAGEEKERRETAAARLVGLVSEWEQLAAKVAVESGPALPAGPLEVVANEADRLAAEGKRLLLGEETLRTEMEKATSGMVEARGKLHAASSARDTAAVGVTSLKKAAGRESESLRPVLSVRPALKAVARTNPEAVRQALKKETEAYAKRVEAGEKAREAVAKARAEHGVKLSVVEERGAQVTKLLPETVRILETAARAAEERKRLLGGRPAADVERELEDAVAAAERKIDAARLVSVSASNEVAASLEKARGSAVVRDETAEAARAASEML